MTNNELILKLRKNEVVHCETFLLAAQCCELAHNLEVRWQDNTTFLNTLSWQRYRNNTCYNFTVGSMANKEYFLLKEYKCISAEEWLNRHNIFLLGQKVQTESGKHIYITDNIVVNNRQEAEFFTGGYFSIVRYPKITSSYPPFPSKEDSEKVSKETFDKVIKQRDDLLKAATLLLKAKNLKESNEYKHYKNEGWERLYKVIDSINITKEQYLTENLTDI